MKILFAGASFGTEIDPLYWGEIWKGLAGRGHSVQVAMTKLVRGDANWSAHRVISIDNTNIGPFPWPTFSAFRHLKDIGPDVVFLNEFSPTCLLLGFARRRIFGRARVIGLVENDPKYIRGYGTFREGRFQRALRSRHLKHLDAVVTNSAEGFAYLASLGITDRAVSGPYLTSEATVARPERSLGNRVRAVAVGQLVARKGFVELLEALARTPQRISSRFSLDIYGEGPQRDTIARTVEALRLQEIVCLKGHLPYTATLQRLADYDLMIIPTLADYRSLAAFEGVTAGLPIIMSVYDGAHREVVEDRTNGIWCDPREQGSLAAALTWFVDNVDRYAEMCAASRLIAKRFTVSRCVDSLERGIEVASRI
jgi:glycosyltransferase involved in cell wall biosynthesis